MIIINDTLSSHSQPQIHSSISNQKAKMELLTSGMQVYDAVINLVHVVGT